MSGYDHSPVSMPQPALEAMLEDAAERGARRALASVGLDLSELGDEVVNARCKLHRGHSAPY